MGAEPGREPLRVTYVDEDYWSLEAIIAASTAITCTFAANTPKEFFPLVGQRAPETIPEKGLRTAVPAWVVPAVDHVALISPPSVYNAVSRDIIHAGAQTANFEALQRHFYVLGLQVCRLVQGERGRSIADALLAAYIQRVGWVLRRSLETSSKSKCMDELEKKLFAIGQKSERRMLEWWKSTERQRMKRKREEK